LTSLKANSKLGPPPPGEKSGSIPAAHPPPPPPTGSGGEAVAVTLAGGGLEGGGRDEGRPGGEGGEEEPEGGGGYNKRRKKGVGWETGALRTFWSWCCRDSGVEFVLGQLGERHCRPYLIWRFQKIQLYSAWACLDRELD
jgi:hypothetical protein